MPGKLILCATPIGNLEDITLRVLRALRESDLIAAEDTRNTLKLLNHYEIRTPLISYHEHNMRTRGPELVRRILNGETVALVTDAGTPAISDPGEDLVRLAYEAGAEVTSLPGPAAVITALTLSGLSSRRFAFEAFLPRTGKERRAVLEELRRETRTIVLYESPHHLAQTLRDLRETLGGGRRISLCRELTKIHETVLTVTLEEALAGLETQPPRGEYVLVLEGCSRDDLRRQEEDAFSALPLSDHMERYLAQGMDRKEAMRAVAKDRGISRRDVYRMLEEEKECS